MSYQGESPHDSAEPCGLSGIVGRVPSSDPTFKVDDGITEAT